MKPSPPLRCFLSLAAMLSLSVCVMADEKTSPKAASVPYDLGKFQAVLNEAKLQAPQSQKFISPGKFAGRSEPFFFLSKGGHLTFKMKGQSHRSELRQTQEWKTSTSKPVRMIGSVRLAQPTDRAMDQFTFMQIHDSEKELNKPLLRLAWIKTRKGTNDHLWSIVRNGTQRKSTYTYVDLGPRPDDFFGSEVTVADNRLRVHLNGEPMVNVDVSYWQDWSSYFKAGVYNQSEGMATVEFNSLRFE